MFLTASVGMSDSSSTPGSSAEILGNGDSLFSRPWNSKSSSGTLSAQTNSSLLQFANAKERPYFCLTPMLLTHQIIASGIGIFVKLLRFGTLPVSRQTTSLYLECCPWTPVQYMREYVHPIHLMDQTHCEPHNICQIGYSVFCIELPS